METLTFVDLTNSVHSIANQLAIEEALLRVDMGNWCLVNRGSVPVVVMGISGKPQELLHLDQVETMGVPILRRYSGGGTVVVDKDTLFVSFIGNHSMLACPPFPCPIMKWSEGLYSPLFVDHPFQLRNNDYVIGSHKVGGNAQSLTKGRFVHHTTWLWDYHPDLMDLLQVPMRQPDYRQGRDHGSFVTTLRSLDVMPDMFFEGLRSELSRIYRVNLGENFNFEDILTQPHRKSTKWIKKTRLQGSEAVCSSISYINVGPFPELSGRQ